jgi:hypothetical protein
VNRMEVDRRWGCRLCGACGAELGDGNTENWMVMQWVRVQFPRRQAIHTSVPTGLGLALRNLNL